LYMPMGIPAPLLDRALCSVTGLAELLLPRAEPRFMLGSGVNGQNVVAVARK